MQEHDGKTKFSLITRFLRFCLHHKIRGSSRLTNFLAHRMKSLQSIPMQLGDWQPLFMDLRFGDTQVWLAGSPYESSPREVAEQNLMRQIVRKGDFVFDIGANIGLHTVLLSKLVGPTGKILAFEPNMRLISNLKKTVAYGGNVELFDFALSDENGEAVLYVPEEHSLGSLVDWTRGRIPGSANEMSCKLKRLDDFMIERDLPLPDFIKCDVEGAELKVFQGARETLNREDAPMILFEANVHNARGFNLPITAAYDYLASLPLPHFRFFDLQEDGNCKETETLNPIHSNILAVPENKLARIKL